jgi:hypothetical protein
MSDVFSARNAAKGGGVFGISSAGDFEELPLLSKFLCGLVGKDGKSWEIPPHSLTVFVEGSVVKCVIGSGDDEPKFFGTISSLASGFQGVETALKTQTGEWKPPKSSKSSWRK